MHLIGRSKSLLGNYIFFKWCEGFPWLLRNHQQWQITFITLDNNGFCLLGPHKPLTPRLANQLMVNQWYEAEMSTKIKYGNKKMLTLHNFISSWRFTLALWKVSCMIQLPVDWFSYFISCFRSVITFTIWTPCLYAR